MPAIPSVVIGLGTTGCLVATRVYHAFQAYCRRTGDNPDVVQFLLLDTDEAVSGAEELVARGASLMVGIPNGEGVRMARAQADPFFNTWWDEEYTNIGAIYPGASMVPAKGRLAFWNGIGAPVANQSFARVYLECANRAVAARPAQEVAEVVVFLVGSIGGGTAAGTVLDAAHVIREVTPQQRQLELHGVLLMPRIMHMVANADAHETLSANGYGTLLALNYWLTPSNMRQPDLGDFMRIGAYTYSGDRVPFEATWLISRYNTTGHAMVTWDEYLAMSADAIAAMTFEDRAQSIHGLMNNFLTQINPPDRTGRRPQPRLFGSLATYALRFDPDKALTYLGKQLGSHAVGTVRRQSMQPNAVAKLVASFVEGHQLREANPSGGEGDVYNEVTDRLWSSDNERVKLYPSLSQHLNDLLRNDRATELVNRMSSPRVRRGRVKQEFAALKAEVERDLSIEVEGAVGVSLQRLMMENRQNLWASVVSARRQQGAAGPLSLWEQVGALLRDDAGGPESASQFLQSLRSALQVQRESLETELGDARAAQGIIGDESRLKEHEENLDAQLELLEGDMFSRFGFGGDARRKEAVQRFEARWWRPWLRLHRAIMAKQEAIALYKDLENEIDSLQKALNGLVTRLTTLQNDLERDAERVYAGSIRNDSARLEEDAISTGQALSERFSTEVEQGTPACAARIRMVTAEVIDELLAITGGDREKRMEAVLDAIHERGESCVAAEAERVFGRALRRLTLWEALVIDARTSDPARVAVHVGERIRAVRARCRPFWKLDPRFTVHNDMPRSVEVVSYDRDALERFQADYGVAQLPLPQAAVGRAAVGQAANVQLSAFEPSPQELRIIALEGGAALDYVQEAGELEPAFQRVCQVQGMPCLSDVRLKRLIETYGLPPWRLQTAQQLQSDVYALLMAEHLGLIDTPLVRDGRTNGRHQLNGELMGFRGQFTLRSNSRGAVFDELCTGPEHQEFASAVENALRERQRSYSPEAWRNEHIACYRRLYRALDKARMGAVREVLSEHAQAIERVLREDYHMTATELAKATKV